ncbi:unnamed protein product [Euphydryas editha]|uniref:Uncharacterized protein n=1 Tax=Euphydryas editha TaxID=104508 RepID=A0AAU9T9I4_EUPED|nr:unnamed protein product [Euphydryas editha]
MVNLVEKMRASIVGTVGQMMHTKLARIEKRLLPEKSYHPPLAADKRKEAAQKTAKEKPAPKQKALAPPES